MRRCHVTYAMKSVVIVGILGLVGAVATAPATASKCVARPPVAELVKKAPLVFVGTVTETTNARRWATVAVEEIWKGRIDNTVLVRAGPADPPGPISAASSVDRTFREDVRYLFFPYRDKKRRLRDSSCSSTTRLTPELGRLRPASVIGPETESPAAPRVAQPASTSEGAEVWLITGAVVAAGAIAIGYLWLHRRSMEEP